MPSRTLQSCTHLTSYHNNNGIIIQFILFELIQAFEQMSLIEEFFAGIKLTPAKKLSKNDQMHLVNIAEAAMRLAGHSSRKMRIFTWNLNDGILAKIKAHCSLFAKNHPPDDPDMGNLQRNAERAWAHCLEILDLLREVQELPSRQIPDFSPVKAGVEKMNNRLRRLAKVIAGILYQFRDDENVLYFLLNQKTPLDAIYEDGFVYKLFTKMFPRGISEAEKFLTRKYTSRGFTHLIPLINQKLSEFEPAVV